MVMEGLFAWKARISPRFVPAHVLAANILDGDTHIARGVVADLSESGASLVTNCPVSCGPNIILDLRQEKSRLFETQARIVWDAPGMDPVRDVVGERLGVSFLNLSHHQRQRIRRLLLLPEFIGAASGRGDFDLLIDPHIEQLFSGEVSTVEYGLAEVRSRLEPDLDELIFEQSEYSRFREKKRKQSRRELAS